MKGLGAMDMRGGWKGLTWSVAKKGRSTRTGRQTATL